MRGGGGISVLALAVALGLVCPDAAYAQRPANAKRLTAEEMMAAAGYAVPDRPSGPQATPADKPSAEAKGAVNPTGQTVTIEVPLKMDKFHLGDVAVQITPDGRVLIDRNSLAIPLKKAVKPEIVALLSKATSASGAGGAPAAPSPAPPGRGGWGATVVAGSGALAGPTYALGAVRELQSLPPGAIPVSPPQYVSIEELRELGLYVEFDPLGNQLIIRPTVEQRPTGDISVWGQHEGQVSANAQRPALVSAYLNSRVAFDYVSQTYTGETGMESPRFDFDAAFRVHNLVLEGEFGYDTDDRHTFTQDVFANYGFYRRGTRLVFDLPEHVLRFRVGDIYPGFTSFQAAPDLLGVQVERSYAKLRPGQNIRATGSQSFRIDRPADVDIVVDGAIVRRIRLQPGNYNVNDLPLRPGANKVTLLIQEDTGQRRSLEFTVFSDRALLAPGINEFQVSGGVRSRPLAYDWRRNLYGEPEYMWDLPVATAFFRMGLTHWLTGELHGQGDDKVAMAGAGAVWQSWAGLFTLDVAASNHTDRGAGAAVAGSYSILNMLGYDGYRQSFRVSADFRSQNYATVGMHDPRYDYWLNIAAVYSRELPWDMSASVSGRYALAHDPALLSDRWSLDLSLSKRITANLSGSLTVGYGEGGQRIGYLGDACYAPPCSLVRDDTGFHAYARLFYRFDNKSSLSGTYDTRNDTSRATYVRTEGNGVGSWNTVVDVAQDGRRDDVSANAALGYVGNRGEVSVAHTTRGSGFGYGRAFDPRSEEQRTSFRAETGIAFADGSFAIGRPVRGSFAIVEPHANLAGNNVAVGARDAEVAHSGALGPALVPDIQSYSTRRVEYDVPNLPLGYDLGAGAFDFFSPYKAGYRVTVGSDYTVTALGTLLGRDGAPIALLAGVAYEEKRQDGPKVQLFTNRAGRFGAQGLAPGRWIVEMPTEPPTIFALDVPERTVGLFNAGTLRPVK